MNRVEHPLIAINGLLEPGETPSLRLATRYAEAVQKAGGIPVAIPPVGGPGDIARLLDAVDGLVLSGGDDFDTERLGLGPTHPAADPVPAVKQEFDLELVRQAMQIGKPMLGICYGMQLMGLSGGAKLLQHLPEDRPGCQEHSGNVLHPIELVPKTRLASLLGDAPHRIVSRHHQALDDVCAPWRVAARDSEGLIEAIEHEDLPFALGVQWHPELGAPGGRCDGLFRALVGAAGMAAAAHLARA